MGILKSKIVEDAGITLMEIVIVMLIIGILAITVIVQFINLSDSAKRAACISNQAGLRTAITIYWSQNLGYPEQIEDLLPQLTDGALPVCPSEGTYILIDRIDVTCSLAEHQ